ncbi:hypothetical protein JQ628_10515 [Bradyrhizobium lablabi]|uniref:hypothetical protein n=1 Tax=Bradyrhizobium lablabi TaxID=722472 RepID=UPI001BAE0DB0|nr:hypothetical protein [Bradyrhizobium lablabi]MBR1121945.1 hypothetical protein [Bradyrhizobium lablabi]
MMMMQRLMRVLGAAIVLVALSLAPSVAQAHNGHSHHASVHGSHAGQAASQQSEPPAAPALLQQSQQKEAGAIPASDRNCVGDCCSFACAACCAAALLYPLEPVIFSPSITRLAFAPSRIVASREPESIRRPPKASI